MKHQRGTTPAWMRPYRVELCLMPDPDHAEGWTDVDIVKLLRDTGMAQSMAEARRILSEQNVVWIDRFDGPEGGKIFDRLEKLKPFLHEQRYLLCEAGQAICVGRTVDEAACHRIVFVERG